MLKNPHRFRLVATVVACLASPVWAAVPKNVILLIGDGMGFEEVKAAGMYLNGAEGTLSFEFLPYQGEITTASADNAVTDSAAAGTAIATGHKVNNGVISMAFPGDGTELETVLEYLQLQGKRTGLVTTTYITHATPACFAAHEPSRNNTAQIASDYLNQSRPHLLFGGGENGITTTAAATAGYTVATDCAELQALNPNLATRVSAQFGNYHLPYEYDGLGTYCHLSEMTVWALDMLEEDTDGFFLMIEGGRIDHAGHDHDLIRNIYETIEFAATAQIVIDWAAGRDDTLIIVTADHETGGLIVDGSNGAGNLPDVQWTAGGHTGVNVPIYAWGVNAELVGGVMDNTEIIDVILAGPEIALSPTGFAHEIVVGLTLPDDSFTVQNVGTDILNYTVTPDVDWIHVDPPGGDSSGDVDTINVSYDVADLEVGTHVGHIDVESTDAINTPQTVTVTLVIKPLPGDMDLDRDVDQDDFGRFQACLSGVSIPQNNAECQNARLDVDADVDDQDLLIFRGCMNGANLPVDPNCAN